MEPFVSPDGRFLFFNNEQSVDTNIHFAERAGPLSFKYLGELLGANSKAVDAVPSMDAAGHFYFSTTREYAKTLKSTFVGDFDGKRLTNVRPAPGDIWPRHLGAVNGDVGVSPDGATLYISPDGRELYFTRSSHRGRMRTMVAVRPAPDVPFEEPRVLTAFSGFVEAPSVSTDLKELFFHKKVGDKFVIYRALRKEAGR